jgi:hypothetical protein
MHSFLSVDCMAHLPSLQSCTIFFMKDLMTGKKEVSSRGVVAILFRN